MIKKNYEGRIMLIIGQVTSEEEKNEAKFIAQVFVVEQRIRYLAKSNRRK